MLKRIFCNVGTWYKSLNNSRTRKFQITEVGVMYARKIIVHIFKRAVTLRFPFLIYKTICSGGVLPSPRYARRVNSVETVPNAACICPRLGLFLEKPGKIYTFPRSNTLCIFLKYTEKNCFSIVQTQN